jgi:hypothetical protein
VGFASPNTNFAIQLLLDAAVYAPELNPMEFIWGYLKSHAMLNFCAKDLGI